MVRLGYLSFNIYRSLTLENLLRHLSGDCWSLGHWKTLSGCRVPGWGFAEVVCFLFVPNESNLPEDIFYYCCHEQPFSLCCIQEETLRCQGVVICPDGRESLANVHTSHAHNDGSLGHSNKCNQSWMHLEFHYFNGNEDQLWDDEGDRVRLLICGRRFCLQMQQKSFRKSEPGFVKWDPAM